MTQVPNSRPSNPATTVKAPAIALRVCGCIGIFLSAGAILFGLWFLGLRFIGGVGDSDIQMAGIFYIILGPLDMIGSVIILLGARNMQKLQSFSFARTAAIVALIPCVCSPCGIFGIAFGIWALVVLSRPEVRSAFQKP
ncbi:MAG: hypothetical protein WCJ97_02695 [Phycisphaerae bacterium]